MRHRHLDYPDQGSARRGAMAVDDVLDRGDLHDWAPLREEVQREPDGDLATTILRLCMAHPMYGTSVVWPAFIESSRQARR